MIIMKIFPQLLVPFYLFSFFSCILSSNPDAEVVQDNSETTEGSKEKFAEIQGTESQGRSMGDSRGPVKTPGIRLFRPFLVGSRIIWRETTGGLDRIRELSPFYNERRVYSNNRPQPSAASDSKNNRDKETRIPANDSKKTGRPHKNNDEESNVNLPEDSLTDDSRNFPSVPSDDKELSPGEDGYSQNEENSSNKTPASESIQPQFNSQNRGTNKYNPPNRGFSRNRTSNSNYPKRPVTSTQGDPEIAKDNPPEALENVGSPPSSKRASPDSNLFSGIVNNFAFKLIEALDLQSNFVISPLSIFIAFSMCYLGSDGNTKAQLEQALGMNDNAIHGEHLHHGIKDLLSLMAPESPAYQFFVANGMFLGKDFLPEPQFVDQIQKYYAAELQNFDFKNQRSSVSAINDWVAKATRNMITSLIDSPPPQLTRLILLNAVYFKGTWNVQFPLNLTYSGRFHPLSGEDHEIPTMTLYGETFPLFRSDNHRHTFIKLPYEGNEISMIIALPYTNSERPMPSVTDQILCHVQDAMVKTQLDIVSIPKFRMEYTKSLRRPSMELGITDLFARNAVNLKKLRKENDVYVSAILHKALIDVNEEGTTASASTAVKFVPLSYRNTTNFVANHPFAFYIVHEPSGLVLFYGKFFGFGDTARGQQVTRRKYFRPRPNSEDNSNSTVSESSSSVKSIQK